MCWRGLGRDCGMVEWGGRARGSFVLGRVDGIVYPWREGEGGGKDAC